MQRSLRDGILAAFQGDDHGNRNEKTPAANFLGSSGCLQELEKEGFFTEMAKRYPGK